MEYVHGPLHFFPTCLNVQSLRKDLQAVRLEKAELQCEIDQRGSELVSSREAVEAVREELEAVRSALLSKSSEVEQAQVVAGQQREMVAQLEGRSEVSWHAHMLLLFSGGIMYWYIRVLLCRHV